MHTPAHTPSLTLPPDLALLGVFWDVLNDIQHTLNDNTPDRAKIDAISGYIAQRIPGPRGGMPSLPPDCDPADPVAILAARLAAGELFTRIAQDMAGEPISARVVRGRDSTPLNKAEAGWLLAGPDVRALRRRGELRTARGHRLIATVSAAVIPERVGDEAALKELAETDTPLGAVIARLGGRREPLWSWPYCGGDTVLHSCARLWLPGRGGEHPAGLATEQVRQLSWWAGS